MLRLLEELSMNAWPALQVILYDGWVLRFADGYTRRSNSVYPLYGSSQDIEEKIRYCKQVYRSRGLNVTYKLTPGSLPRGLDDMLAQQEYKVDAETSVQTLNLNTIEAPTCVARLEPAVTEEWLSNQCRLSKIDDRKQQVACRILRNIIPAACYASIDVDGKIVACGLGVLEGEFLGLYDIVTDEEYRERGYGRQMMLNLLTWGIENGARTAYLQVMLNNAPALGLYEKLGFQEVYQYWYRVSAGD